MITLCSAFNRCYFFLFRLIINDVKRIMTSRSRQILANALSLPETQAAKANSSFYHPTNNDNKENVFIAKRKCAVQNEVSTDAIFCTIVCLYVCFLLVLG